MTWEATHRRKRAVEAAHDVVDAMRAIAAGRFQGAQRALDGARRYHEVVLRALATLLDGAASLPIGPDHRPATLVVMTSEQPLRGSFNASDLAFAERRWELLRDAWDAHLVVVGRRGIHQIAARGIEVAAGEPAAITIEGLLDLVKRPADLLGRRHAAGDLGSMRVVFNRYRSLGERVPAGIRILPPDLEPIRRSKSARQSEPFRYLAPAELLGGLVREYSIAHSEAPDACLQVGAPVAPRRSVHERTHGIMSGARR